MVDIKLEDKIDGEDIENQDYQIHNKKDSSKVESSTSYIKDEKEVDAKRSEDVKVELDVKLEDFITEETDIKDEIIFNDENHKGSPSGNKRDGNELDLSSTDSNSKTVNIAGRLRDFCYYCKIDVSNFSRHLRRHHIKEAEVEKIFFLPPKSKKRTYLIGILRKRGKHIQILNEQSQPSDGNKYPCKYCFGYYRQKTLWRHMRTCGLNDGSGTSYSHLTDGQNLLVNSIEVDNEFKERVFSRMFADEISLTAKKDVLICMYGAHYFRTHRNINSVQVCTRKIRELAQLLLEVREVDATIKTLFELLNPKHYALVVECAKQITYSDVENSKCKTFTYAYNIRGALKQCCDLAILTVQKNQYVPNAALEEAESNFNSFKQLLKTTWKCKILEKAKFNRNTFDIFGPLLSRRRDRVLVPWTKEQKTLITEFFKKHIKISKLPKESECELLKQKHPNVFSNKTWKQMKVYIQNIYTQKYRKKERLEKDEDNNKISLDCVKVTKERNTVKIDNSLETKASTPNTYNTLVVKKKHRILVPWTKEQKKLIISFFKNHIRRNKPPKEIECELLKQTHPGVFNNKTWQQMKVYIQNIYTQKQKMKEILEEDSEDEEDNTLSVKIKSRVLISWTEEQRALITEFFKNHIKRKQSPRRNECDQLKQKYPGIFDNKMWQQMKMYIQNSYSCKHK